MLHVFHILLTRILLIVFLYQASSCKAKSDKIIPVYNNYKFDPEVIKKLPVYDSLTSFISGKIHLFQNKINENDSYQAFRYMPVSNEPEVFKKLPDEFGDDIDQYFTELGKDFIYGFDVFKDSTIKIYIRRKTTETAEVEIEENLSYYPAGGDKKKREYPVKDTTLNMHWQYWTRFDTPGLF